MKRESPADNPPAPAAGPRDASDESAPRKGAHRYLYGAGDRPLGGYTIKRGVGRGGFGEVYFAVSDAGKEVALKLIRRNLDVELRGVRQCLNLKHPNLIALYDIRSDERDDQWVVMEYVQGESLEDRLARSPQGLPADEALAWVRGVAAGVSYLHASGVVHRDLKPGNLFFDRAASRDGRVSPEAIKIGDYGLSKFLSTSRRSGNTESVGTVHYMAPEIAGGRYGREIDTYALGVILYEMLTGRVPFEGESVGEVLMKHLTAEPELSALAEPFRTIVARALAKDPQTRLGSVDELVALLPAAPSAAAPLPAAPAPAAAPAAPRAADPWSPVSRPPHTDHPTPQPEPLWRGMVELSDSVRRRWSVWDAPPLLKSLILVGSVVLLVVSGAFAIVPAVVLPLYLAYYVVWAMFLQEPPAARASRHERTRVWKPTGPPSVRYDWRAAARRERSQRSPREKAVSLTGSMLGAAAIAAPVSALLGYLVTKNTAADPVSLGLWLATVSTLGAWGTMLASAFAEARLEDGASRRGLNLLVGLALGAFAFAAGDLLALDLPYWPDAGPNAHDSVLHGVFDIDLYAGAESQPGESHTIRPPLEASVLYFGLAMMLVRWWRAADYLRASRTGFWSNAWTAMLAWGAGLLSWYPQPLGAAVLLTIGLATQVASPWCPPSRRVALARGATGRAVA